MSLSSMTSYCSLDPSVNLPIDKGFATFFWYLYQNRIGTDVEIHVETADGLKEYHVHKLIFSIMSPVFAERFYKDGKYSDKVEKVLLRRIDIKAFEGMLRFMYKGSIPRIDTPNEACGLYQVALKYEVTALIKECQQYLTQIEVEPSNVFTVFEIAESTQNKSLTDRCFAFIQTKTREVMKAYALSDISTTMMHIILDLPSLSLTSEYELHEWVFSWAKERANTRCCSIREVLQNFLCDMHFLKLTNVEFTKICRDYSGCFTNDEIVSIFMNIAVPGSQEMPDWYNAEHILRVYPDQNEKSSSEKKESSLSQNDNEETESEKNEKENKSEEIKNE